MLIIAGKFEVDPKDRDAFLRDREEVMRVSRAEEGCFTYVFSADPIEPGLVHLYERWESPEALAAHLTALRARPRSPGGVPVISSEILQYDIAKSGPVGG